MNQRALDYEEFTSGFQSARDAAIAESRFRHEQVEFDRLCVQLAKRAWSACLGSQDPEEARLARARWRDAHRELACSQQRVRLRSSTAEESALTFACVCAACGALWESRQRGRFCSRRCARGRRRTSPRASPANRIRDFLRTHPGATASEIRLAVSLKPRTVRNCLARARVAGFVVTTGKASRRRYWLGIHGNPTGVSEWTLRLSTISVEAAFAKQSAQARWESLQT